MGLFDYYIYNCPWCGEEVEDQSKAGDCTLSVYKPGDNVLMDMMMVGETCCSN